MTDSPGASTAFVTLRMRPFRTLPVCALLLAAGCQAEPPFVYVPVAPPQVDVSVSVSLTNVTVGQPVVLFAQRQSRGEWKRVARDSLAKEQCWVARPPPDREAAVADNLHWQVSPSGVANFNLGMRPDRSREVVFSKAGTYVLHASSAIWCGAPEGARANPVTITVGDVKEAPAKV